MTMIRATWLTSLVIVMMLFIPEVQALQCDCDSDDVADFGDGECGGMVGVGPNHSYASINDIIECTHFYLLYVNYNTDVSIDLPSLEYAYKLNFEYNDFAQEINLLNLQYVRYFRSAYNDSLDFIFAPSVHHVKSLKIAYNHDLHKGFDMRSLENFLYLNINYNDNPWDGVNNNGIKQISFPAVDNRQWRDNYSEGEMHIHHNYDLQSIDFPDLIFNHDFVISDCAELNKINVPKLEETHFFEILYNGSLDSIEAPKLKFVFYGLEIKHNEEILGLSFPSLDNDESFDADYGGIYIHHNSAMVVFDVPDLRYATYFEFEYNHSWKSFTAPSLISVDEHLWIKHNNDLNNIVLVALDYVWELEILYNDGPINLISLPALMDANDIWIYENNVKTVKIFAGPGSALQDGEIGYNYNMKSFDFNVAFNGFTHFHHNFALEELHWDSLQYIGSTDYIYIWYHWYLESVDFDGVTHLRSLTIDTNDEMTLYFYDSIDGSLDNYVNISGGDLGYTGVRTRIGIDGVVYIDDMEIDYNDDLEGIISIDFNSMFEANHVYIHHNEIPGTIDMPMLKYVNYDLDILYNYDIGQELLLPSLNHVEDYFEILHDQNLRSVQVGGSELHIGYVKIQHNDRLQYVSMPQLFYVNYLKIRYNTLDEGLNFPALETIDGEMRIEHNTQLPSFSLPALNLVMNYEIEINYNDELTSIDIPRLVEVDYIHIYHNPMLNSVNLQGLVEIGYLEIWFNSLAQGVKLNMLYDVTYLDFWHNTALPSLNFPKLYTTDDLYIGYNENLLGVNFPNLDNVGSMDVENNLRLSSIDAPLLTVGTPAFTGNACNLIDDAVPGCSCSVPIYPAFFKGDWADVYLHLTGFGDALQYVPEYPLIDASVFVPLAAECTTDIECAAASDSIDVLNNYVPLFKKNFESARAAYRRSGAKDNAAKRAMENWRGFLRALKRAELNTNRLTMRYA